MPRIGNRFFNCDRHTYICGILNVTPDSFSDGGRFYEPVDSLKHVEEMIRDGASIIDVGGESTRPGYKKISDEEEIRRIVPVIEGIKRNFDIPVSLDTYKSGVARAGIEAGADMINDIWGLKYDHKMADVLARHSLPVCIMHNRDNTDYGDFMTDVISDLNESINIAKTAGINEDDIILDPGVGFAKSLEQNIEVTAKLSVICDMGYPVLLGVSRKSMIGLTLDLPVDERLEGTLGADAFGFFMGAGFLRVHDVKEHVRLINMMEALRNVYHTVYLSVGSNIGDRLFFIDKAIRLLMQTPEITVNKVSNVIETAPYGKTDQADFLNAAIKITTTLSPESLLKKINRIEEECGRDRENELRWGPRTLDLDILLFDDLNFENEELTIPHADMANRSFVLDPLCEIAPGAFHPVFKCSVRELRKRLDNE